MNTDIRDAIVLLKNNGYTIIPPTKTLDEVLEEWIAYKKERGQTYKSRGLSMCRKKLMELSNGSPTLAQEIVEQSMANNWAGLFPLRNQTRQNTPTGVVLHENRNDYENDKGWG